MIQIVIHPLKGIIIDDQVTIDFGMKKDELFSLLGTPSSQFENECYYENLELRFDLDSESRIEFIESYNGPFPEYTVIELYELNPFETLSDELVDILDAQNLGETDISEAPYCYRYLESSIGIYRDATEEDALELIEETKENGQLGDPDGSLLEDLEKSKYFWTIGFGKAGYYE